MSSQFHPSASIRASHGHRLSIAFECNGDQPVYVQLVIVKISGKPAGVDFFDHHGLSDHAKRSRASVMRPVTASAWRFANFSPASGSFFGTGCRLYNAAAPPRTNGGH